MSRMHAPLVQGPVLLSCRRGHSNVMPIRSGMPTGEVKRLTYRECSTSSALPSILSAFSKALLHRRGKQRCRRPSLTLCRAFPARSEGDDHVSLEARLQRLTLRLAKIIGGASLLAAAFIIALPSILSTRSGLRSALALANRTIPGQLAVDEVGHYSIWFIAVSNNSKTS